MGANPSLDRSEYCGYDPKCLRKPAIRTMPKNLDSFRRRPRPKVLDYKLPVNSSRQNVRRTCEDGSDVSVPYETDCFSVPKIPQQDNMSETSVQDRLTVNGRCRENWFQHSENKAMGSNPRWNRSGSYEEMLSSFKKQAITKISKKSDSFKHQPRPPVPDYRLPVNSFRQNDHRICEDESDVSIPFENDFFSVLKIPQQDNISETSVQDKLTVNERSRENWFQFSENRAMGSNPSWDTSGSYEEMLSSFKKQAITKKSKKSDSFKDQPRSKAPDYQLPVNSFGQNDHRISEDESDVSIPFETDFFSVRKLLKQDNITEARETTIEKTHNPIVDKCPLEDVLRADAKSFPVDKIILQDNMTEARETSVEETKNPVVDACPFEDVLYRFYTGKILTDALLQTSSELFPVHKLVLCCRSAVFSAMFAEDMNVGTSNSIEITEDADTLHRLLLYIYTNEVKEMQWQNAADLFKAADKYDLLDLKKQCSIILKHKISRNNFCDILSFADMYHETELLDAVLDFISQIPDIFTSEAWKLFKRENPELALNTTERIINTFRIPT